MVQGTPDSCISQSSEIGQFIYATNGFMITRKRFSRHGIFIDFWCISLYKKLGNIAATVFFFQSQAGKEDSKCFTVTQKPRYSEQIESGVLVFVALGNTHGKDMGFRVGISQQSDSTPGDPH